MISTRIVLHIFCSMDEFNLEVVFRSEEELIECFKNIVAEWKGDQHTAREACGVLHLLQDEDFVHYQEFLTKVSLMLRSHLLT